MSARIVLNANVPSQFSACSNFSHRCFSSTKNAQNETAVSIQKQKVLSKTIYKQLIKWTASQADVPFDPIPPLALVPPRVDATALETMARLNEEHKSSNASNDLPLSPDEQRLLELVKSLPSNSVIEPTQLVLSIENAKSVKKATKLAYALNNYTQDSKENLDQIKERVSLGFDVLKSLNQMTEMLDERKMARENHQDRSGVTFRVGQVVRHKKDRWRAIVGGWKRTAANTNTNTNKQTASGKSSLTNKTYDIDTLIQDTSMTDVGDNDIDGDDDMKTDEGFHDNIEYVVHIDEGDAAHSRVRVLGSMKVKQHELEIVTDDDLKRVRNSAAGHHFERFDSIYGEFTPGNILKFEYPIDKSDAVDMVEETERMMAKHENAKVVLAGVKGIAARMHRIIMDTSSCAESRKLCFLPDIEEKLKRIVSGDLLENVADKISSPMTSSHKIAIRHLSALFHISLHINDILWQRNTANKNFDRIRFPLGSIVKHKKYGFRGVVVTWDPYPKADVSNWDGLQDIDGDVQKMPFYHVIPHLDDTVKAFGRERPFRYVCQENLEECPVHEQDIEVVLDEGWSGSDGENQFCASVELKFRHAEKVCDEDKIIEKCLNELTETLNDYFLRVREAVHNPTETDVDQLRLDDFFTLLQNTESLEDAFVADEGIKEIWKAHIDQESRWSLDDGITNLLRGDKSSALDIYDALVEADPQYMEAWNKKATCHYMLGEMPSSILAAEAARKINDLHYQAHAGLGLVYSDNNQYKKAAQAFRKTLSLNPWSPVSSRLNTCLDTLNRLELDEDTT